MKRLLACCISALVAAWAQKSGPVLGDRIVTTQFGNFEFSSLTAATCHNSGVADPETIYLNGFVRNETPNLWEWAQFEVRVSNGGKGGSATLGIFRFGNLQPGELRRLEMSDPCGIALSPAPNGATDWSFTFKEDLSTAAEPEAPSQSAPLTKAEIKTLDKIAKKANKEMPVQSDIAEKCVVVGGITFQHGKLLQMGFNAGIYATIFNKCQQDAVVSITVEFFNSRGQKMESGGSASMERLVSRGAAVPVHIGVDPDTHNALIPVTGRVQYVFVQVMK